MKLIPLLLLIPAMAFATVKPDLPAKPVQTTTAAAQSHSESSATSDSQSNANSGGNVLAINQTTERQAPSLGQGSLYAGDCGAGANGGGSNTSGAAFLGVQYTTHDCYLLKAAQSYMALGMPDAACDMLNGLKAVQKRYKALGKEPPPCVVKTEVAVASPSAAATATPPDLSQYATKADLERAFKAKASK